MKLHFSALIGVLLGWLMDLFSTWIGLQLGYQESSQLFTIAPWLWGLALGCLAFFIQNFRWAPKGVRGALILALILYSFTPALSNTILILRGGA